MSVSQNLYHEKSLFHRWLSWVIFIALITINTLVLGIILDTQKDDVCVKPECYDIASSVISKMKSDVEPCDDFYNFVCGRFIEEEKIPGDLSSITQFSIISTEVQNQLNYIVSKQKNSTDPEYFHLPNTYYKACMNTDLIEQLGIEPIHNIGKSLGGWPLLTGESWDSSNTWTWEGTIKEFGRLGFSVDYIMSFYVGSDLTNSTKRIIDIDEASTGLGREYLIKGLNEPFVSAYYEYMVDIAVLFGANRSSAQTEMMKSLQFEIDLANISLPQEDRRNSTALYNKRSLKQMQETYPFINWVQYINSLLPSGITVNENEEIRVSSLMFMNNLAQVLTNTPKRTVANYLMWRLYSSAVSFLPTEFRDRQQQYKKITSGVQEQPARWKTCVDAVNERLGISVGSLYVQQYFPKENKEVAKELVENLINSFDEMLTDIDWMDPRSKTLAKKKLNVMQYHIGYPDELLDNDKIEDYYRGLSIDSDKYFQSNLNINIFAYNKFYSKLREPVNKSDWQSHSIPAIVNAFYSPQENSILFPAAILQGHFFNAQRPKYMNYGSIGHIIGHEITHGFDDQGSQFDLNGNLFDWWEKDTKDAYLKKAQCIINQYGGYTERNTGLKVNGVITQGENIADNGGVKESYNAYRKWTEKNEPEPKLPGLNYTPNQMFWISAGQTLCSKVTLESLKDQIKTDPHSPAEIRVMGVMRNMKEFSEDFQCPENAPMNPMEKCGVW